MAFSAFFAIELTYSALILVEYLSFEYFPSYERISTPVFVPTAESFTMPLVCQETELVPLSYKDFLSKLAIKPLLPLERR